MLKIINNLRAESKLIRVILLVVSALAILAAILCIYELYIIIQKENSNKVLDTRIVELSSKSSAEENRYNILFEAVLYNNEDEISSKEASICKEEIINYGIKRRNIDITSNQGLEKLNNSPEGIALKKCSISVDSIYMSDYIQNVINATVKNTGFLEEIKQNTIKE